LNRVDAVTSVANILAGFGLARYLTAPRLCVLFLQDIALQARDQIEQVEALLPRLPTLHASDINRRLAQALSWANNIHWDH